MEFLKEVIFAIAGGSGFAALDWKTVVMLVIACVLLYMGIGKGFEPLLLVPIAFGIILIFLTVWLWILSINKLILINLVQMNLLSLPSLKSIIWGSFL